MIANRFRYSFQLSRARDMQYEWEIENKNDKSACTIITLLFTWLNGIATNVSHSEHLFYAVSIKILSDLDVSKFFCSESLVTFIFDVFVSANQDKKKTTTTSSISIALHQHQPNIHAARYTKAQVILAVIQWHISATTLIRLCIQMYASRGIAMNILWLVVKSQLICPSLFWQWFKIRQLFGMWYVSTWNVRLKSMN